MDKAGQKYWDDSWASTEIDEAVDPSDDRIRNYINRRFHQAFTRIFAKSEASSMRLLEIGCAKSAWLPYFAKEFGFSICGIDYSPIGCDMARKVLDANGAEGRVVCADIFLPPKDMLEAFDVVVSFGVVEHFDDTALCLRAASKFLKPGGLLVTNIPNMVGWVGRVQELVNKPVYGIHQLIDRARLREAHESAGLEVIECDYFVSTSFSVANLIGIPVNTVMGFLKRVLLIVLGRVSILVWLVESKTGYFPATKLASPYVNCVARKP